MTNRIVDYTNNIQIQTNIVDHRKKMVFVDKRFELNQRFIRLVYKKFSICTYLVYFEDTNFERGCFVKDANLYFFACS